MPARLDFSMNFGPATGPRRAEGPWRLLLVGDFSGASAAARRPLAERPTLKIDIDSLDTQIARLAPALDLPQGRVEFRELEDFHPDALYARMPLFDALREARRAPPGTGKDLLGSLLGGATAAPAAAPAAGAASGIDALVRQIVAPHVVPDTRSQEQQHRAAVDAATAEQMRALLHAPAFQSLEAAWRGVQWLVSNLELDDETLQLHLFDATRDELLADIVGCGGQLASSGLYRAWADRWRNVPGGQPWSLVAGLGSFGGSDVDVGLLAALGIIAGQAGGPFVAGGDPALATAPTAGWQQLRASEAARWIGLAAPRLLLRLPYGAKLDPVSAFSFEELPAGVPEHEHLLWGPGSLAVALLAARGDGNLQIGDLPAYAYAAADGERELQACAERHLGEQTGLALLQAGLMPLMSHRHANAVTVMRLQTIGDPPQALPVVRADA